MQFKVGKEANRTRCAFALKRPVRRRQPRPINPRPLFCSRRQNKHTHNCPLPYTKTSLPRTVMYHTFLDKLGLGCHIVRSPRGSNRLLPNAVNPAEPVGHESVVFLTTRQAVGGVREICVPALGERQVVGAVQAVFLPVASAFFVKRRVSLIKQTRGQNRVYPGCLCGRNHVSFSFYFTVETRLRQTNMVVGNSYQKLTFFLSRFTLSASARERELAITRCISTRSGIPELTTAHSRCLPYIRCAVKLKALPGRGQGRALAVIG